MAQPEEEGWPLGLGLLNEGGRIGIGRNGELSAGSISFNTLLTCSTNPSIHSFSSDLDSQSTGSFYRDRSITLGSLIGIPSFLQLSRRSSSSRVEEPSTRNGDDSNNKNNKDKKLSKPYWMFSLCPRLTTNAVSVRHHHGAIVPPPSLGQYLEAERRRASTAASTAQQRSHCATATTTYGPNDFSRVCDGSNSLSNVGGQVAAVQSSVMRNGAWELESNHRYGAPPIVFSCLCG